MDATLNFSKKKTRYSALKSLTDIFLFIAGYALGTGDLTLGLIFVAASGINRFFIDLMFFDAIEESVKSK